MDLNTLITPIVALVIAACGLIGLFARKADDPREVLSWARAYRVTITPANRASVVWFVRASITLRVLGAVSGLVLGSFFDRALVLRTSTGVGFWVWILLGWMAGALWAESHVLVRPPSNAGASLVPRRISDYLPVAMRWSAPLAAFATTTIATFGLVAGRPAPGNGSTATTPTDLFLLIGGSLVLAAWSAWAERRVVGRRQPAGPADLIAVDDAVRASTVHLVSAASTAAILLLGTHVAMGVLNPRQLPFGLSVWVPASFVVGALLCSRYFAYRAWRVRRPTPSTPAVST